MKKYMNVEIEIIAVEEDVIRTSPINVKDDDFSSGDTTVGSF